MEDKHTFIPNKEEFAEYFNLLTTLSKEELISEKEYTEKALKIGLFIADSKNITSLLIEEHAIKKALEEINPKKYKIVYN